MGLLGQDEPPPPKPSAKILSQPGNGTGNVNPSQAAGIDIQSGSLTDVTLTSSDGKKVAGQMASNRQNWTATEPLEFGKAYTWSGSATGADGKRTAVAGTFHTVTPARLVHGQLNIDDNQNVGVAAPIVIEFDSHVDNKAEVEKKLSVQTSTPTEGSWAWLPDTSEGSRVHWRPKDYWRSGTSVTVNAPLLGVDLGGGAFGKENMSSNFTIGRNQVVKGDTKSHQMVIERDGKEAARYDASYGMDSDPRRATRSGIHVVNAKAATQRMRSPEFGYDVVMPWAVQINNNGEFIHTNTESVGSQGASNISHGCINLNAANGKEYFESALYGDPVEITGSSYQLSADDGDIYDWTIPWDQWRTMSALNPPQAPAAPPTQAPAPAPMAPPALQVPR